VYWLTDRAVRDELAALKQRGVDVQIIIDESIYSKCDEPQKKFDSLVVQLLGMRIFPIVYPSKTVKDTGIMHDKFVVIDDEIVFTGTANLTGNAINPEYPVFNYEHTMTIYNVDTAQRFSSQFEQIKHDTFDRYIDIVASDSAEFKSQFKKDSWFNKLVPLLHDNISDFQKKERQSARRYDRTIHEKRHIGTFFRVNALEDAKEATWAQNAWLNQRDIFSVGLSRREAVERRHMNEKQERQSSYNERLHKFKQRRNHVHNTQNLVAQQKAHIFSHSKR
jgi:hypothetical protein